MIRKKGKRRRGGGEVERERERDYYELSILSFLKVSSATGFKRFFVIR